ncbi:MAG: hypothetical protein WAP52_02940, partial [Candidatus Sungiibacteriota bacterium]
GCERVPIAGEIVRAGFRLEIFYGLAACGGEGFSFLRIFVECFYISVLRSPYGLRKTIYLYTDGE